MTLLQLTLTLSRENYFRIFIIIIIFLYLGRTSRGGRQKLILEIITLMANHPSGSHQRSSRAAG